MSNSNVPLDTSRTVDVSLQELDKIRRRLEIRKNLQNEFNRLAYNPYRQVYRVNFEDPAVNRFMAARVSFIDYWRPTWGSFFKFCCMTAIPITVIAFTLRYLRLKYISAVQTGQIRAEDREYKALNIGHFTMHPILS